MYDDHRALIYLDHNATTPTPSQVRNAMLPFLEAEWGNPSSSYRFGQNARNAVNRARQEVATFVGCSPSEVIFTSGATEANNAAIHSARSVSPQKRHVVTSNAEHSSVLLYCENLVRQGHEVTFLPVEPDGSIDLAALNEAIRSDTAVVSLMWANNETGVISEVEKIAMLCRRHEVLFHCDSVQALGKIPLNFSEVGIDMMTMSGHKLGAPKGVGALIVRDGVKFEPLIVGGKQEHGRRGGTENVPYIVGLGAACRIAAERPANAWDSVSVLRDKMENDLLTKIPGAYRNGSANRLPNTLNLGIPRIENYALVAFLDARGISVSSGSACMESALAPSHVILAMTRNHGQATESLRISLGLETNAVEIVRATEVLIEAARMLR